MSLTDRRKKEFAAYVSKYCSKLGLADVGFGIALKSPWNLFPAGWIWRKNFESAAVANKVICLSNCKKWTDFYVAQDERFSSLHEIHPAFLERYGLKSMALNRKINVECRTLDECLVADFTKIDALDLHVGGHDFQVLQGGAQLLTHGFVKLVKVEFELTQVWTGQGWFSDIDSLLRGLTYDLVDIDIEYARPIKALDIDHRGEPLWGSALYMISDESWAKKIEDLNRKEIKEHALKAMALSVLTDHPGRALGLLDTPKIAECFTQTQLKTTRKKILDVFSLTKADRLLGRTKKAFKRK